MRKLFSFLAAGLLLVFNCLPVCAADTLPITHQNSYTYTVTGGGSYEYTVPFTGNYELTLAGASGSAYGGTSGGAGHYSNKIVRLQEGDVIKVELCNQPDVYTDGDTLHIPGADLTYLYLNGQWMWIMGGGYGAVSNRIAPTGITQVRVHSGVRRDGIDAGSTLNVHWHSGNGKSGATHANTFPTVYSLTNPGGCYSAAGHTHDKTGACAKRHVCDSNCYTACTGSMRRITYHNYRDGCSWHSYGDYEATQYQCSTCNTIQRLQWSHGPEPEAPKSCCNVVHHCTGILNTYNCGNSPVNTWTIQCGYSQGQILGEPSVAVGTWGVQNDAFSVPKVEANIGNSYFNIRLCEQQELFYKNLSVQLPYYLDRKCNLILKDNTVVYYKRS